MIGPSGFGGLRSQDPRTARGVRLRVLVMVEGSVMSAMVWWNQKSEGSEPRHRSNRPKTRNYPKSAQATKLADEAPLWHIVVKHRASQRVNPISQSLFTVASSKPACWWYFSAQLVSAKIKIREICCLLALLAPVKSCTTTWCPRARAMPQGGCKNHEGAALDSATASKLLLSPATKQSIAISFRSAR